MHENVCCDGCGESPIIGVRYKCAVCKDFDYCANCEDKLDHDHPFLKIKKAGGAPAVMVTVLNEDEQPQPEQQRCGRGGRGGRGGFGRGGSHHFGNMVNGFLEKMGVDVQKIADHVGKNPWSFADGERCGGNKHKQKRALLV